MINSTNIYIYIYHEHSSTSSTFQATNIYKHFYTNNSIIFHLNFRTSWKFPIFKNFPKCNYLQKTFLRTKILQYFQYQSTTSKFLKYLSLFNISFQQRGLNFSWTKKYKGPRKWKTTVSTINRGRCPELSGLVDRKESEVERAILEWKLFLDLDRANGPTNWNAFRIGRSACPEEENISFVLGLCARVTLKTR